jgi:hypothetical protein
MAKKKYRPTVCTPWQRRSIGIANSLHTMAKKKYRGSIGIANSLHTMAKKKYRGLNRSEKSVK